MAPKKPSKKPPARKPAPRKPSKEEKGAAMQRALKFVELFHVCGNITEAAKGAGFSPKSASAQGSRLLKTAKVQAALAALREKSAKVAGIDGAEVLRRLEEVASVDANELTQVRRISCRYCHGDNHAYQFKPSEWRRVKASDIEGIDPDRTPSAWYDPRKAPHPDCPECFGDGEEEIFLADTRKLSTAARQAYAGAELTKHGVKVNVHNKVAALVKLGENAGLFSRKLELSGKGGGPIRTDQVLRIEFVKGAEAPKGKHG